MSTTGINTAQNPLLGKIERETDERKLLALAWLNEGMVKIGNIEPGHYAECAIALVGKLGFPPLPVNLAKASAKFLGDD